MGKALSIVLRERLISAFESGILRRSAARLFSIARSTAIKWVDQRQRTGRVRGRWIRGPIVLKHDLRRCAQAGGYDSTYGPGRRHARSSFSRRPNAKTTLPLQDMTANDRILL